MRKWIIMLLANSGKVSSKRLAGMIGLISGIILIAFGINNSSVDILLLGAYGLLGTTIFQKHDYENNIE